MRPRDILSANLRTLMAARPDLNTLPKLTARSGVSNGTLDRIRRAAVSTRVDELEKLAHAFGIEPCELLRPAGRSGPSPLAMQLAAHLDRSAKDPATHMAAYAAALAVIDAMGSKRTARPARAPAVPAARGVRAKAKADA